MGSYRGVPPVEAFLLREKAYSRGLPRPLQGQNSYAMYNIYISEYHADAFCLWCVLGVEINTGGKFQSNTRLLPEEISKEYPPLSPLYRKQHRQYTTPCVLEERYPVLGNWKSMSIRSVVCHVRISTMTKCALSRLGYFFPIIIQRKSLSQNK